MHGREAELYASIQHYTHTNHSLGRKEKAPSRWWRGLVFQQCLPSQVILQILGKARGEEGLCEYCMCAPISFFLLNNIHLFIAPKLYTISVAQRQDMLFGCQPGKEFGGGGGC